MGLLGLVGFMVLLGLVVLLGFMGFVGLLVFKGLLGRLTVVLGVVAMFAGQVYRSA